MSQQQDKHEWLCLAFSPFYESHANEGNEDVFEISHFISKT